MAAITAAVVAALVIAGAIVELPYFAISPGSARQVAPIIAVEGSQSYPPRGSILFTTVSLGRVTAYEALAGWLDDDTKVVPEDDVLGGATRKEYRRQNVRAMADSKELATFVALRHLGYPVKVHGDGAQVATVEPGTPAATALEVGDVITAVDGAAISLREDLVAAIRAHKPGETVRLSVENAAGARREVAVTLAANPEGLGFVGVATETVGMRFESFPVSVDIKAGDIGGPSAGLAFTLAILDVLTPGELTGGKRVAVTGTIDEGGSVGPVGGVDQKTAAARKAGAEVLLVPSLEYEDAKARAGESLRVEKVDSLEDALRALAGLEGSNALALAPARPPAT